MIVTVTPFSQGALSQVLGRVATRVVREHVSPYITYGAPGSPALTVCFDGLPVACIGITQAWKGYGVIWGVFSLAARRNPRALLRIIRGGIQTALSHGGFRRLDAFALADWPEACRLIEALGFTLQTPLPHYGPSGETYNLYTRYGGA